MLGGLWKTNYLPYSVRQGYSTKTIKIGRILLFIYRIRKYLISELGTFK